jgi:hypothetical protein
MEGVANSMGDYEGGDGNNNAANDDSSNSNHDTGNDDDGGGCTGCARSCLSQLRLQETLKENTDVGASMTGGLATPLT